MTQESFALRFYVTVGTINYFDEKRRDEFENDVVFVFINVLEMISMEFRVT
jgi:hypothetical protein